MIHKIILTTIAVLFVTEQVHAGSWDRSNSNFLLKCTDKNSTNSIYITKKKDETLSENYNLLTNKWITKKNNFNNTWCYQQPYHSANYIPNLTEKYRGIEYNLWGLE